MRANLQALAHFMVPMSQDRVREVMRQCDVADADREAEFMAVEGDDSEEFWKSAPAWPAPALERRYR